MKKTTATVLSFDHTFKVSKHICTLRDGDSQFVGQFSNLFVGLNENKEIVTWKLTRSTKFEDIESNLKELNERTCKAGNKVKTIFVDDCCKVRGKYQTIFGAEQEVKLDLFHAVQRISSTVRKGTEISKKFVNAFGLVFRNNFDLGQTRNMPTPKPSVIEQNIENFERRWADILATPDYEKTQNEIDKIKVHVRKGCLSGINPGEGTAINENLHHFINRCLLCGSSTIGPELAITVLTILFYTLNSKRKGHHHDRNARTSVSVPIESIQSNLHSTNFSQIFDLAGTSNKNGTKGKLKNSKNEKLDTESEINLPVGSPVIVVADSAEDFCQDDVAKTVINHSREVYTVLEQINNTNYNRSFNVLDVPLLQLKGLQNICNSKSGVQQVDEPMGQNMLTRNLSGLGLEIDNVEGDGNCCFTSIVKQVSKLLPDLKTPSKERLELHLHTLGFFNTPESISDDAHILRQLFVEHIQESIDEYATMLGIDRRNLFMQTEQFKISGVFNSDVGDIVVKTCSEILNLAIVVVTSMDSAPYIPFVPARFCCDCPLYVAYSNNGVGHYDSTKPSLGGKDFTAPLNQTLASNSTRCTCGKNNKEPGKVHCLQGETTRCPCASEGNQCCRECKCKGYQNKKTVTTAKTTSNMISCSCGKAKKKTQPQYKACIDAARKSKCKCLKFNLKCTSACECYNCHNGCPQPASTANHTTMQGTRKRKRENPSPYKRVKGSEYLEKNMAQTPLQGNWTHIETFILVHILSLLSTSSLSPSINETTKLYNFIADYENRQCHTSKYQPIRNKSPSQVSGKIIHIKEIQEINEALLLNN